MRAVLKKASWGTRRIFRSIRCKKQAFPVRKRYSVPKTAFCGTRRIFKVPQNSRSTDCGQPPAHRTHFQRRAVPKSAYCRTGCIFSARNAHRSEVIRLKRGCIPWKSLRIHPPILILKIVSHRCHHAHFLDIRSVAVAIFYRENSLARSLDFAEAATGVTREFLSYFTSVSCSFLHH